MFQVWKTIKLGTGLTTADDFRTAIESAGMRIDDHVYENLLMPSIPAVMTCETEVELVVATAPELGLDGRASLLDIYVRAKELGLELCPAEVGPQLRLQYTNQPLYERLYVAMEPVAGPDGYSHLYCVRAYERDDETVLCLDGSSGILDGEFGDGYQRFVFLRSK